MKVRGDARRLIMGFQSQISVSGTVFRTKRQHFYQNRYRLVLSEKNTVSTTY